MSNICEHFKKDYSKAVKVAYANAEGTGFSWEWVCNECGQIYREKIKEPIDISNE